jgi:hypothetical protein
MSSWVYQPLVPAAAEIQSAVGAGGQIKVWDGTQWVAKPVKVWNGSEWIVKPLKYWDGTEWVTTPY